MANISGQINPGKWFGSTDASTKPHMFFYSKKNASEAHVNGFQGVWDKIHELMTVRDGNNWLVLELIFTRPEHENPVIAFRFTSDWAYNTYWYDLLNAGGSSVGRGVFDPFKSEFDFENFIK